MKRFFKNHVVDATIKTIFILAVIHIVSLSLYALSRGAYEVLNVFHIVGLDLLFPALSQGILNFILSLVLLAILYCGMFFL